MSNMDGGNNNNSDKTANQMPEPSLSDLVNLISRIPTKNDFAEMQEKLLCMSNDNKIKIETVERQVENVSSSVAHNSDKIANLEYTLQTLQQEKLRNNVCISGVPIDNNTNINQAVIKIAGALQVMLREVDFSAYSIANNKFIIVNFNNYTHKQMLLSKIRIKKSLMVEEVYTTLRSNGQIYINDHLTKYFNNLYLMAREAKKSGKLASATSSGGKIRVRKQVDEVPIIVTDENQLQSIINNVPKSPNQTCHQSQPKPSTSTGTATEPQKTNTVNKSQTTDTKEKRTYKRRSRGSPKANRQPNKQAKTSDSTKTK